MATVAKNVTLDEAIQKSQTMNNTSYLWIIEENVIELEVPEHHRFSNIGVVWHNFTQTLTAAASLPSTKKGVLDLMAILKEDGGRTFSNFEELRATHPKLFEVKGDFRILQT